VSDRTEKAIALLRFAEHEFQRLAEAGVSGEHAQRIANLQRVVRTIVDELDPRIED
jgi:hypothetical protein